LILVLSIGYATQGPGIES